jgi:hypothetical protein
VTPEHKAELLEFAKDFEIHNDGRSKILSQLRAVARDGGFSADVGTEELRELLVEIQQSKPKPTKSEFDPKKGQRPARKVSPQAVPRVRLKNYPEYQIDKNGTVYDLTGKMVAPRWRNGKCWVRIYDHERKRVTRNVYWLMVDSGYVTLSEKQRAWERVPAGAVN